ncbi:MAG: SprT family zinc-dependent metalloprotease [Chitinophagaceae bacterium]|nr:SprT family zinc-dependent metalloprotease [Chitinophagaceae bacterium]
MVKNIWQVPYGTTRIEFNVAYSSRKTLGISVYPNAEVQVVAPYETKPAQIEEKIMKKAAWISRQIRRFKSIEADRITRKIEYVPGETFYLLGRKYRLKYIPDTLEIIRIEGRCLVVRGKTRPGPEKMERLISNWYRAQAKMIILERWERHHHILRKEKFSAHRISIRSMKHRWGSCTENGSISFNVALVQKPVQCIDYVIVHELCHLKYMDHGKGFYRMLGKYMGDWERRKARLESSMH